MPRTSTFPSLTSCVIPVANAIKQPVRPMPALQWTTTGPGKEFTSAARLTSASAACGTAWSGHESYLCRNNVNKKRKHSHDGSTTITATMIFWMYDLLTNNGLSFASRLRAWAPSLSPYSRLYCLSNRQLRWMNLLECDC